MYPTRYSLRDRSLSQQSRQQDPKASEAKKEQSSTPSVGEKAPPLRRPSWASYVPPSQSQSRVTQDQKTAGGKEEQSKEGVKQDQKTAGAKEEQPKEVIKQDQKAAGAKEEQSKEVIKQDQKDAGGKEEQSSISGAGSKTQFVRQPSSAIQPPQPQSELPKSESKQEVKDEPKQSQKDVIEAKKEEPTASMELALVPSAADTDNKQGKMIVIKDGVGDEAGTIKPAQNQKGLQLTAKDDFSNLTRRLGDQYAQHEISMGNQKRPGDELGVRVITMAGENKGATMDLGSAVRNNGIVGIHRGYKLNQDKKNEVDPEPQSKGKSRSKGAPVNAYVNSNVQVVNNCILYNSTCPSRDPGVHLGLSNSHRSSLETRDITARK
eukprot:Gb_36452 [translate_table: standard]